MKKLVKLLRENARLSNDELAVMLGITEKEVAEKIAQLEKDGTIIGYSAIINEEEFYIKTIFLMTKKQNFICWEFYL